MHTKGKGRLRPALLTIVLFATVPTTIAVAQQVDRSAGGGATLRTGAPIIGADAVHVGLRLAPEDGFELPLGVTGGVGVAGGGRHWELATRHLPPLDRMSPTADFPPPRPTVTAPAPAPAPAPVTAPAPSTGSGTADWYAIAACESGGRWNLNTGNGYWGGLQFAPSTWFGYGGGPFDGVGPFPYSAAQQIAVAERVLAGQGPGAWPHCFRWK